MPLFFSYFCTNIRFVVRKYRSCGHAVDPPVDGVKSLWGYSPCSIMTIRPSSSFGATARRCYQERIWLQVLETLSIRKPVCRIYPDKRGGQKHQAILPQLYNVVLTGMLAVLCRPLYRIYIKCGVLLEVSMSSHQLAASCLYPPNQVIMVLSAMRRTTTSYRPQQSYFYNPYAPPISLKCLLVPLLINSLVFCIASIR